MLIPFFGIAQYEKMLDLLDDSEQELVNGKLVLRLFNAETGSPVPDASVNIEGIGEFTSDIQGRILFDPPQDMKYAFRFSKQGYISCDYGFEVIAGTIFYNRFSVSPVIDFGALRVVLEWDRKPNDLDLHIIKEGDYHISYQNMHNSTDGTAKLDRDDRDAFGPETITITNIDEKAAYTCYVKNFSDKDSPRNEALSKSKAIIRVYGNNKLLNTWQITPDQKGTSWKAFMISNGKIQPVNEVSNIY
jgi:hypothetical protein